MGVQGLWDLLSPAGHPVDLSSLSGQVLAIDISIWLNQSIKGIRDKKTGRPVDNAHLVGLFNRVCKLLFYKIKPVFVFDGGCPELKKQTIAARQEQRLKAMDKSKRATAKIIQNYINSQLEHQQLSAAADVQVQLPELASTSLTLEFGKDGDLFNLPPIDREEVYYSDNEDEGSDQMINVNDKYFEELQGLDIDSKQFKSLPANIRHELLTEMRQRFKSYRHNVDMFPKNSNDFSSFQMNRLLKKRNIQSKIEQVERELNGQDTEEILSTLTGDSQISGYDVEAGRLLGDENTRFVLLKKTGGQETAKQVTCDHQVPATKDLAENESQSKSDEDTETVIDSQDISQIVAVFNQDDDDDSDDVTEIVSQEGVEASILRLRQQRVVERKSDSSDTECEEVVCLTQTDVDSREQVEADLESVEIIPTHSLNTVKSSNFVDSHTEIELIEEDSNTTTKSVGDFSSDSFDDFIANYDESQVSSLTKIKPKTVTLTNESSKNQPLEVILESDSESTEKPIPSSSNIFKELCRPKNPEKVIEEEQPTTSSKQSPPKMSEEERQLHRERNKQDRYANTTTSQMAKECQELLNLFGIPYVVSPMEAEAQCSALEQLGLTQGTITDDSDIWLFGARTVYKNFFTTSKLIEVYKSEDIEKNFGFCRSHLVCIAMLCGSDYTDGVDGVGVVKATEIISEFPGEGLQPLRDFKKWWLTKRQSRDRRPENKIRASLIKLNLIDSFPSQLVFDAYINPTVDLSKEKFTWGTPLLDVLRDFAMARFDWTQKKVDDLLLPVMKKVSEKQVQTRIDDYFKVGFQPQEPKTNFKSKRLVKALDKMLQRDSTDDNTKKKTPKKNMPVSKNVSKVKNQRKKKTKAVTNRKGSDSSEKKVDDQVKRTKQGSDLKKKHKKTSAKSCMTLELSEDSSDSS